MRVDTFGRTHIERAEGAQPFAGQVAVHRAGGQNHGHGHAARPLVLICQHQMPRTRAHGIFGLGTDTFQPLLQRHCARLERAIDLDQIRVERLRHALPLGIAHKGAIQHQNFGLRAAFIQHVFQIAKARFQAHHAVFAQAVDGRVCDLAKILAEEMRQRAIFGRQHRAGGVIAHRGHGLFRVFHHGRQDLFQLFNGIARSHLAAAQLVAGIDRRFGYFGQRVVQLVDLAHPFAKGLGGGKFVFDFAVVIQHAFGHIHGQQLARAQRAFFHNAHLVNGHHPRLGAGNQQAITRQHIAHRAQPVAIKPGTHPAAIGHGQRCGAVPRLHHAVAIGIHIAPALRQFHRLFRPRFRHKHGFRHGRRTPGAHQHLEHRIQRRRIRATLLHDRLDIFCQIAKGARGHANFVAFHPVHIAL